MSNTTPICPVCDERALSEKTYSDQFACGKHTITVHDLEGYLCHACGAEPIFPKQILRGQIKIADAKRQYIGLLTSIEIKSIRKSLGLTQKNAATIFGGGVNAFSKYERGDVLQSEPMDNLLRMAVEFPKMVVQLRKRAQV